MPKTIIGIVSSDKADKTIVVTVRSRKTHPLYRKQYSISTKFMAHDEKNEAQVGDKVSIIETRPLSARKRFTLERIIEKPVLREDSLVLTKTEDDGSKDAALAAKKAEAEAAEAAKPKDTEAES